MIKVANAGDTEYLPSRLREYLYEYKSIVSAEKSLLEFTRQAWPFVVGGGPRRFIDGWWMGALCEHLEAFASGEIRKLLINVPPRTTKSTTVSVMLPAWMWLQDPSIQFLCASGGQNLAIRDSDYCCNLIQSFWYRTRWGHLFELQKGNITKKKFANNKNGYREITSVKSKLTGFGGDIRILDDPNDVREAQSIVVRTSINEWFAGSWSTRANNFMTVRDLLIQQRTNEEDVTGFLLAREELSDEWVKLIIPMEFERDRRCKTIILPSTKGRPWEDPRKEEGELLWPERVDAKELKKLKASLGSPYQIAGQFQQRPAPAEGGILKAAYFSIWQKNDPPETSQIIQSWDTALSEKDSSAYSVCTTWSVFLDNNGSSNVILMNMWRGKVEYPELRKLAKKFYKDYRDTGEMAVKPDGEHVPDYVIIEDKSSGSPLVQDLRRAGVPVVPFIPKRNQDKIFRAQLVSHLIESGRVWLPGKAPFYKELRPFAKTFLDCCVIFPAQSSLDVVDTMTQMLMNLMRIGVVTNPQDPEFESSTREFKSPYGIDDDEDDD